MNIVAYGGGTNSTAMLIGLCRKQIPVDLILFSDTGGEHLHTYGYFPIINGWLAAHGMPEITRLEYRTREGLRLTLEQECLQSHSLPSIAYGYKSCSLKHKVHPQEKYCNHHPACREAWKRGEKINKFIGYDAGEGRRKKRAEDAERKDKKYNYQYPLIEWGWSRDDCIEVIRQEGLPLPGKSSCFFCPSMRPKEIRTLYHRHRDLYERAVAIEREAKPYLTAVKGLGRNWAWEDFVEADANQIVLPNFFPEDNLPCGCYSEEDAGWPRPLIRGKTHALSFGGSGDSL